MAVSSSGGSAASWKGKPFDPVGSPLAIAVRGHPDGAVVGAEFGGEVVPGWEQLTGIVWFRRLPQVPVVRGQDDPGAGVLVQQVQDRLGLVDVAEGRGGFDSVSGYGAVQLVDQPRPAQDIVQLRHVNEIEGDRGGRDVLDRAGTATEPVVEQPVLGERRLRGKDGEPASLDEESQYSVTHLIELPDAVGALAQADHPGLSGTSRDRSTT
jgi:hypothetical protein